MSNLSPQPRIGLELSEYELYPPLIRDEHTIWVTTRIRHGGVQFDFTVNGESGSFPGIRMEHYFQAALLKIDKDFIANYNGSWPVQLKVIGSEDAAEDSKILTLYDTRTMQAEKVDVRLIPPGEVQIPPEDETTYVVITGTFYDANGLELPDYEITKKVEANPTVPGVEVLGHRIYVSSMPHTNEVHMLYAGAGTSGNLTVKLVK